MVCINLFWNECIVNISNLARNKTENQQIYLPDSSFSPLVITSGDGKDSGGDKGVVFGNSSGNIGCGRLSKL